MTFIMGLDLSSAYRIAGQRLMGHRRQSDAALWYVGPLLSAPNVSLPII